MLGTKSESVPQVDDLGAWLASCPKGERFYWKSRDGALELACFGHSDEDIPGLPCFVGWRFDASSEHSDEWAGFDHGTRLKPAVCMLRREGTIQLLESTDAPPYTEPMIHDSGLPRLIGVHSYPSKSQWCDRVSRLISSIRAGDREKLVLAKKLVFEFDGPLDAFALLQKLSRNASQCYQLAWERGPKTFISVTPERLYARQGRNLLTEAVAGTRGSGRCSEEAEALAKELLDSTKDRKEHWAVVRALQANLQRLCSEVTEDSEVSVLRRAYWQHLYYKLSGRLKPEVTDHEILQLLHPTPAVGGLPKEGAAGEIRKIEQFDRGWYAAPVGWISEDAAEFCVAIRSGVVEGNQLTLYVGCGIVADSDPEAEWEETKLKAANYKEIFCA